MRNMLLGLALLSTTALAAEPGAVGGKPAIPSAQALPEAKAANFQYQVAIVEPRAVKPDAKTVAKLKVPVGFAVEMWAEGLGNARLLAVTDDGTVYLTRRAEGDVVMLRDTDGDGKADLRKVVAQRPGMHGIALDGRKVYLAAMSEILTAPILADGSFGPLKPLTDTLPDTGQHNTRTVRLGPDGQLYITVGSTCNECVESSPESATLLRMSPDGKSRIIYASGLRDTIGYDWNPKTGALWGMDHGIDMLGDDQQPEELNKIGFGKNYGWPYIYGFGGQNPQDDPPNDLTMADLDAAATRPVLGYTGHAAPMQMLFYRGVAFPKAYQGDAFVTFRGSWNRSKPSGYEVARIHFDAAGEAVAFEPFLTGFLQENRDGPSQSGRPVGLAVARDGSLLFTDDINGVIYRVRYTGADAAGTVLAGPAVRAPEDEPRPVGPALALARPETRATMRLTVTSPAFGAGQAIPPRNSDYQDGVSPALSWSGAPAGTASYVLLLEDPDSQHGHPFIHWVAWNIPTGTTALPEALPGERQLAEPKGMRQGRTTRGSTGYYGPKPPVGDPPHHYHVQLFALSEMLDLPVGADRERVLAAMTGKVLARGELVGTYAQGALPPKK
ncbi:YbhB/YbcL family Raf kinase inhibitor-like protein [Sphingomonas montanisoli]|uniref:YbhB/YbcL family Raf kinase inhibitor-like protein n=1 Tax=Sphingomonas montanisoli TaxID=2606412 RepID=A0A5D9C2B7_9SPHN|nr:YbhB/YbcL family Raf kinase inhibitor-like protein [Sphingomonas montanisoli]TZG25789.1 YbhB/YbcL family Raf kinase inhibitor-like protein [Sphingomonas montanisoli]